MLFYLKMSVSLCRNAVKMKKRILYMVIFSLLLLTQVVMGKGVRESGELSHVVTSAQTEEAQASDAAALRAIFLMDLYDLLSKSFSLSTSVDVPDEPKSEFNRFKEDTERIAWWAAAVKLHLTLCRQSCMDLFSGRYIQGFYLYSFGKIVV